ncbi:hypothetical protein BH09BAC6_BH09BAC6_23590 [soil metagenome]|jgi:hypothetical protein
MFLYNLNILIFNVFIRFKMNTTYNNKELANDKLVLLLKDNSHCAFKELYSGHASDLAAYVNSKICDLAVTHDVLHELQELFITLWEQSGKVWRKMGGEEKYEWLNDSYVDINTASFLPDRKGSPTKVMPAFFIAAILIAAMFVLQLLI